MQPVSMLQAQSSLSRLVETIKQGKAREIVITRNGRAVAKLVPIEQSSRNARLGVAKGQFVVPDDIDANNQQIAQLTCSKDKAYLY
ncbi:type II toxin-antitoxin system Phd/YefM family antitoxin [Parvibium lacunae]|uniref:Antitoxin n=1 Tax=Parvibium lacunae TaxID=1888893 RepID=A0A368L825_9BURK|nr:type II toxin-antitoxin system Phd/YefM family antitoxin [Parvibium lacunae]RCS59389.1 prevent-host-death protein [Parvibium lacunae]